MQHWRIEAALIDTPEAGPTIQFRINPVEAQGWPNPDRSTTWLITNEQGQAALTEAGVFKQQQQDEQKYTYNEYGIGCNRENCASFASKILRAAGIKQSAGLIFATPLQVATKKALGERATPKPAPQRPPAVPKQYDI